MAMANTNVEMFNNRVKNNKTLGMLLVSYLATDIKIEDPDYYPYPEKVYVHDNTFEGGGTKPGGSGSDDRRPGDLYALAIAGSVGKKPLPDIAWDGYYNGVTASAEVPAKLFCLQNNGAATFVNLDLPHDLDNVSFDEKPHDCALTALPAVTISGVE
jgi:hypothetical protein